jgi:formiminoglutamase
VSPIPAGTVPPQAPEVKFPLLLSVPHAGERIPAEAEDLCALTRREIIADGDEGAREVYDLRNHVVGFVTTDIARAIVDVNRAEDDFRKDGVIKTHTCWDVPVYRSAPPRNLMKELIIKYYRPYHSKLKKMSATEVMLGIDCHTMASTGPPVGPDSGRKRPFLCLSNDDGTLPEKWLESLARCLGSAFGFPPAINDPFKGGFIIRSHAAEMPWVQLEVSREPFMPLQKKREKILEALGCFCALRG